jgi:hypothetical protein
VEPESTLPWAQEYSLAPILNQNNPVHATPPYFSNIHFYTILPPRSRSQAKGPILGFSARTQDLLKLNRDQLRWVVRLVTGHCHLKGRLFKLGLTDDPICERRIEDDTSATHILCDCEAVAYLRFRHLRQFFMEPRDYYNAPIYKVLHFIRGVGLIKD